MAKKKSAAGADSVQAKAKAMRDAQARADKRTRNIIVAVVTVVIVAIIVALVLVVQSQSRNAANPDSQVPAQFANGEPIVISHEGVGQKDENLADLEIYFSYSCSWCAYLDSSVGENLSQSALNGDFNLVLQPVNTAQMPFQPPATFAALQVAANAPEQFIPFHQALADFFFEASQNQDSSVIGNLEASQAKVNELAQQVGVPQEVIDQFGGDPSKYLEQSTNAWREREIEGRGDGLGTPEIVFKDTVIRWSQGTPEEIYSSILQGMSNLGYQPGQK